MKNSPIDLVVTWLDDQDPLWQAERAKYSGEQRPNASLFRDWRLMRYWFRGVEKFLPWIRRIHFVTWGHVPTWLNTTHPKLHIVRHEDYLPAHYRPVFSSIPIELSFHLIDGIAEQFISVNDDFYFLAPQKPDEYFCNGQPCDYLHMLPITDICTYSFGHILWNDLTVINQHFDMHECASNAPDKWFSDAYSEKVIQNNRAALQWNHFVGFGGDHYPIPLLKSTYAEIWKAEPGLLEITSRKRFRDINSVNNWLIRYWQLASGRFFPYMQPGRRFVTVGAPPAVLRDAILSADTRILCLNEGNEEFDFAPRAAYIRSLFERRLPEMSSFEKF